MKNLALIAIAILSVSAAAIAQTEPVKPKAQPLKTEKGTVKKKGTTAKKETPAPATSKKAN